MPWRRKKRDWDEEDWFDEFFRFPFEEFDELFRRMMREFDELIRTAELSEGRPIVRGFSIRIGPDGKPEIREFGTKPTIKEDIDQRKPLVDVIETDEEIQVIAEMPGVNKEDIELSASETKLEIKAEGENRKYYEVVDLPDEVDPDSAKARYNNGVLEVVLKKKHPKKESKKRINIE
ncbi:Molecular chaperone {small heat shock protein} [Geoglobus ahangari]|uniref:Molecular chaperone (small heat shock protein) n=1 Tax=Geoglobus ahangari TaxID=113653 RepID=A0A0F7ID12_9EURY|nr:archaeal heat shock protein Hsp20 [Geoglobus ahangari]AKG90790.1 Molecular chaperone {small heat shock protein} [Geoglobus ahangari]NOY11065.1 Hsp20/alpha crystallin family protein [Archaeoglobi archaeon]